MRREELDSRSPSVLDITPDEADRLRSEYEAAEQAKAARRAIERRQVAEATKIAHRRLADLTAGELADDLAWARSVLVDGETFESGDKLFLALYTAKKASLARSLGQSEVARLRRVLLALWPEVATREAMA